MMIHSLSLVLVLSFTIAVHVCAQDTTTDAISATSGAGNGTQLPVYPCTSNEGKPIAIGAKFNSSCNSCTCMANGGAVCTEKGCLSACYDDRAKGYGLEESRYDGCYQYLCTPSGWSKPIQICASTGVATSTSPPTNNPTNLPVSSTGVAAISSSSFSASIRVSSTGSNNGTTQLPTTSTIPPVYACTSNEGKPIAVDAGYRGKCNHCTCAANGASMCTLMFCPSPCYDDNGKGYALEQSRYNGCYQYLCTPGGWSKPIQICASTGVATSTPTKQPTNLPVSSTGINNNPTCLKKCTQFCINGLECRDDEMGCKKCLPKLTTNAPTCPENLCEGKCEFKCEANFDTCTYKCKEPSLGETFRTLQFLILYNSRRSTNDTDIIREIHSILVYIADSANIPRSDYVINDKDGIKRLIGLDNSRSGIWLIKMGFRAIQHPDGDERLIFLTQLFRLASPGASIFAESSQLAGLAIDSTQSVTTSTEFMEEQTCDDGRTISATQQCVAVTSTVAISSSSSSTSIPIAAIVAPIVGGVVLLSIIITAFIIIRRRGNAVKTMEGMNREMANFTPIEGEQRV